MTFTFDGLIRFSAEHAGLTNEQFQRDDIEDYVVYNIQIFKLPLRIYMLTTPCRQLAFYSRSNMYHYEFTL